jgi:hypothetical protein
LQTLLLLFGLIKLGLGTTAICPMTKVEVPSLRRMPRVKLIVDLDRVLGPGRINNHSCPEGRVPAKSMIA